MCVGPENLRPWPTLHKGPKPKPRRRIAEKT